MTSTNTKYTLKENESYNHRFTKQLIFRGLSSGEIIGFYDDRNYTWRNPLIALNKWIKMEYPFLDKESMPRPCYKCGDNPCKMCYYIPNTRIRFICDIVVLDKFGRPKQVIEIVNKKELSEKKLTFYLTNNLQVVIIRPKAILKLTKLYSKLKVDKIIEGN